ncbi:GlxA family transcriptional regulator [Leisingera thetidis]|uniref:GlxA family transcriptional regulator n=1 Tax=Leisingera thetidis TaxID=2930199 RepID=UPI0021F6FFF2|nr:helix-turn-helix domain-containing protein [Leisingera thetidis]
MPSQQPTVILNYPGSMPSAVLGLNDILSHAGLAPLTVAQPDLAPAHTRAVILPPSACEVHPSDAPWVTGWLAEQSAQGALICSACTGLHWIAAAGIDRGRPVTTHWGLETRIRLEYPALQLDTARLVIEHTDLVTAGGLMAWIDLALVVIERLAGRAAMLDTARHFIIDPGRRDQRRYRRFLPPMDHGDRPVLAAQQRIEAQLAEPLSAADLAAAVGLSLRSLQRRFTRTTGHSLTAYQQNLRIERARDLLTTTGRSVAEIAAEVGYSDLPAFHRVFSRQAGMTPGRFRRTHWNAPSPATPPPVR